MVSAQNTQEEDREGITHAIVMGWAKATLCQYYLSHCFCSHNGILASRDASPPLNKYYVISRIEHGESSIGTISVIVTLDIDSHLNNARDT